MGGGRVAGLMGSSTGETTDIGVSGNSAGAALERTSKWCKRVFASCTRCVRRDMLRREKLLLHEMIPARVVIYRVGMLLPALLLSSLDPEGEEYEEGDEGRAANRDANEHAGGKEALPRLSRIVLLAVADASLPGKRQRTLAR